MEIPIEVPVDRIVERVVHSVQEVPPRAPLRRWVGLFFFVLIFESTQAYSGTSLGLAPSAQFYPFPRTEPMNLTIVLKGQRDPAGPGCPAHGLTTDAGGILGHFPEL